MHVVLAGRVPGLLNVVLLAERPHSSPSHAKHERWRVLEAPCSFFETWNATPRPCGSVPDHH